jgi:hypothetical protein
MTKLLNTITPCENIHEITASYIKYLEENCPVLYVPLESDNATQVECSSIELSTQIKQIYYKTVNADGKTVLKQNRYYIDGSRAKTIQILDNHVHTFVRTIHHFRHDISLALWSIFFTRSLEKPSTGTFGIFSPNCFGACYGQVLYIPLIKQKFIKVIIFVPIFDWNNLLNNKLTKPIRTLAEANQNKMNNKLLEMIDNLKNNLEKEK